MGQLSSSARAAGRNSMKGHISKMHTSKGVKRTLTTNICGLSKKKAKEEELDSSLNDTREYVASRVAQGKAVYNLLDETSEEMGEEVLQSTAIDESVDEILPPNQEGFT